MRIVLVVAALALAAPASAATPERYAQRALTQWSAQIPTITGWQTGPCHRVGPGATYCHANVFGFEMFDGRWTESFFVMIHTAPHAVVVVDPTDARAVFRR